MQLKNIRIGLGITGSFCTFSQIPEIIEELLKEGAIITPILSVNSQSFDTRFGKASEFIDKIEKLTNKKVISNIVTAEPIGPNNLLDVMLVLPCTGNSLAKLAYGITDDPVLMATKAHLRNIKPVVIGISTNDALGTNAKNIGSLLNSKNIYFVPFGQDNPAKKPNSLVYKREFIIKSIVSALDNTQLQPILV